MVARMTPAIFVISWDLSSKALVLLVRTQICHFRRFRQKFPRFGRTKAQFAKGTAFGTPIDLGPEHQRALFCKKLFDDLWVMDARTSNHGRPHREVRFPAVPVAGRETFGPRA